MTVPVQPTCILIPSFNNAATIADVVRRSKAVLDRVIVIDDGSTDGTGDAARAAGAWVLTRARNGGKGRALADGMREALRLGFIRAITLDGDAQHRPEDATRLIERANAHPEAVIVGVRRMDADNSPKASRFGRRFSDWWVNWEAGARVHDSQSGFRSYPLAPITAIAPWGRRYDWEVEVLIKSAWVGLPLEFVEIEVYYPPREERVSHFHWWHDNAWITWANARAQAALIGRLLTGRPPRRMERPAAVVGQQQTRPNAGVRIYLALFALLGRYLGYILVQPVVVFFHNHYGADRRALQATQARIMGPLPWWRRHLLSLWTYYRFAMQLVDRACMLQGRSRGISYEMPGRDAFVATLEARTGAILVGSHLGHLEVLHHGSLEARRMTMVVRESRPGEVDRLASDRRVRERPTVAPIGSSPLQALELLRQLRRGAVVAFKPDRAPGAGAVEVPFLGGTARFSIGPFLIAATARVPMYSVLAVKQGLDHYRLVLEELPRPAGRNKRAVARAWLLAWAERLEAQLRRHPDQWFNFFPVCVEDSWVAPGGPFQRRFCSVEEWAAMRLPPEAGPERRSHG